MLKVKRVSDDENALLRQNTITEMRKIMLLWLITLNSHVEDEIFFLLHTIKLAVDNAQNNFFTLETITDLLNKVICIHFMIMTILSLTT